MTQIKILRPIKKAIKYSKNHMKSLQANLVKPWSKHQIELSMPLPR